MIDKKAVKTPEILSVRKKPNTPCETIAMNTATTVFVKGFPSLKNW